MSSKRQCEDFSAETPRRKSSRVLRIQVDSDEEVGTNEGRVFYFRVLLPNGITLELQVPGPPGEMPVEDFVILVRREYQNLGRRTESPKPKRQINWTSKDLHFVDAFENRITKMLDFRKFKSNQSHMIRLCDGSAEADKYENMWDLTPDTDLLKELPEEYTFETALADLIDNSLQAVWSKSTDQRRLISLELTKSRITIFDTGLGMDGSAENSIVKWGKMGASLHRLSRDRGIGGKPPYLTPYFGMFGYGGPIASMHLGRRASVSSKTKECKKVFVLHLERDSLLRCSSSQQTWRTDGNVRDPLEDELRDSVDGSFTKVEIFYPKMRSESIQKLQYKLKDIYFPYIQCDEVSKTGKTVMPIEFQVNGTNLAEIEGGEVATTNLLSCNGPEFVMQLSFHVKDSNGLKVGSGTKSSFEAHARLRCVYFPMVQGKESIEVILEKLEADRYGITENFETFSHVSVRRLGRLLPDARWSWLPFMEPKLRKSDRAEVLKRCCFRVKCFIETDAGFNPTPSKALPQDVDAGHEPPEEITAVVRPASFSSVTASKNLDQKYIMKENFEMTLEIKFKADENEKERHIYSGQLNPSSLKGFHGLYMFPLKKKSPNLFQKAGIYLFRFSLIESRTISVKEVRVKALSEAASWELVSDGKSTHSVRVGSCFPEVFSVACCDRFCNRIPFKSQTEIEMKLSSGGRAISSECSYDQCITHDRYTMKFKNVTIESSELDMIRPSYKATIHINSKEDPFFVAIPCAVIPGPLQRILLHPVNFGKKLVPGMVLKELALETFDKYGNHMRKDEHIKLTLEGLHLLDKGDSFYKVDDHGYVNLSGTLKVTAGYGKLVSLSVLSGDEVVFKKEFQTDRRSLRVASKVPKVCAAGSHLEDVVFEVINSAGEVDEDIDSEVEDGHSHTLLIRQDSLREEDNVRYSFHRGRCIVRSIPLPDNEGLFCFVASHSRFHDLQTSIEVHVEKAVICTHELTQPRSPKKEILLLEDSNGKGPETVCHNTFDGRIMIFNNSCASMHLEDRLQKLRDDICRYGLCIRQCDANVESLNIKQSNIELEMSNLGAFIGLDSFHDLGYDKDVIMEKIEGKADSAAAVIHKLLRSPKPEQLYLKYAHDILGVVALLGEVRTHKLSSMLSTYLGEDQMLAVVCKSRAAARALENYQMDGNVNCASALDILAAKLGISIKGRYLVICLEDIRPYKRGVSSDPQRELAIPHPTLSNRETPPGFLGYAVNMIFLPAEYLQFRTASGHGLRETLFYRLFGKLQVYKSREQLYMASSCIEEGAVSLDGGMMRGNGVVSASVGSEEPYILFPVICLERQLLLSPEKVERLKRIEELKLERNQLQDQIQEELRNEAKYKKKLAKKLRDKKQIDDQLEPSPGMYSSDMDISC
ncbi:structural maintenance of chromosomes flexible hinge domain-containing protein GMI1 [Solanum verrucosum]|uniref:structural maintenance of chromosomes flexible hinge domain-containing protein GMI1 n=1 Tax=Solanum verrucosum TaxID=315347 RepID=UPI0020CFFD82|nr:structural maintenance of chromosomes flexible hinge domain-containing protein GMI1 [Solanum verrucosum]